jgi:hypothetical protein
MSPIRWAFIAGVSALLLNQTLQARPIVFARSTMAMVDYREGAMAEAQVFYAPKSYLSLGLGHMELDDGGTDVRHAVTFARLNLLARRWNMAGAQANVFVWGGLGNAYLGGWTYQPSQPPPSGHDHGPPPEAVGPVQVASRQAFSYNAGGQIDYETRRVYLSIKTDLYDSDLFWHRADTVQFGIAPYPHDTNTLATWFVISGRNYTGDMHEDTELAFLLRFFKKRAWLEAGATTEGKIQAMAMFSF